MVPPKTCRSGHTGAPASQLMMDLAKKGFQLRLLRLRHLDSSFLGTNGYLNRPFLSSHVIPGSTYLEYLAYLPRSSRQVTRLDSLQHTGGPQESRRGNERDSVLHRSQAGACRNWTLGCWSIQLQVQLAIEAWRSKSAAPA